MGVVRREGDWRLEKVSEGYYEITYQREAQLCVLTLDYDPGLFDAPAVGMTPVQEVNNTSEAVGLFEEKAHGPPPFGMGGGDSLLDSLPDNSSGETEDIDLTPGMLSLALILTGGLIAYTQWPSYQSRVFQMSILFVLGGFIILAWAGYIFRNEGWREAMDFLFQTNKGKSRSTSGNNGQKTPPAPQSLKEEILFDRANHHCEWCGERFDGLQIHHIEPRSEGGPNTKRNLMALCPNCHDRADRGGISKTQLKGKVRRIMA